MKKGEQQWRATARTGACEHRVLPRSSSSSPLVLTRSWLTRLHPLAPSVLSLVFFCPALSFTVLALLALQGAYAQSASAGGSASVCTTEKNALTPCTSDAGRMASMAPTCQSLPPSDAGKFCFCEGPGSNEGIRNDSGPNTYCSATCADEALSGGKVDSCVQYSASGYVATTAVEYSVPYVPVNGDDPSVPSRLNLRSQGPGYTVSATEQCFFGVCVPTRLEVACTGACHIGLVCETSIEFCVWDSSAPPSCCVRCVAVQCLASQLLGTRPVCSSATTCVDMFAASANNGCFQPCGAIYDRLPLDQCKAVFADGSDLAAIAPLMQTILGAGGNFTIVNGAGMHLLMSPAGAGPMQVGDATIAAPEVATRISATAADAAQVWGELHTTGATLFASTLLLVRGWLELAGALVRSGPVLDIAAHARIVTQAGVRARIRHVTLYISAGASQEQIITAAQPWSILAAAVSRSGWRSLLPFSQSMWPPVHPIAGIPLLHPYFPWFGAWPPLLLLHVTVCILAAMLRRAAALWLGGTQASSNQPHRCSVATLHSSLVHLRRIAMALGDSYGLPVAAKRSKLSPAVARSGPVAAWMGLALLCAMTGVQGQAIIADTTLATSAQCSSPYSVYMNSATGIVYAACSSGGVIAVSPMFRCVPGHMYQSGTCSLCSVGEYRNHSMVLDSRTVGCESCIFGSVASSPGSADCISCTGGSVAVSPRLSCSICTAGFYSSSAASICSSCQAGYYGSANALTVATCSGPCLPGYWCASGSMSPMQFVCGSRSLYCPRNSTSPRVVPPGMYAAEPSDGSDATMSAVLPCPSGSYCTSGAMQPCAAGSYQNQTGQSICLKCERGLVSAAPNATGCAACSTGTFADASGSTTCPTCISGRYSNTTGQSTCVDCDAGSIAPPGSSSCALCAAGFYATAPLGTTSCLPCSPGFITAQAGRTSCVACGAGTSAADSNATECAPCSPGTYMGSTGSTSCLLCLPGRYASANSSSTCFDCPIQTYASSGGLSACMPCASFTYAAAPGSLYCFPCGLGQQGILNSSSLTIRCQDCEPGYASVDGGTCSPCPTGAFSAVYRAVGCTSCAPGRAQSSTAALNCTACVLGRFSSSSGASHCDACPSGTESQGVGASFCSLCPSGYERGPFAVICTPCTAGSSSFGGALPCEVVGPGLFVASPGSAFAQPCPVGRYQNESGATDCIDCRVGSYQAASGSPVCSPCRAGSYARRPGQAQCDSCTAGRSSAGGQSVCSDCAPGTISEGVGAVECSLCSPGTYQNSSSQASCSGCPAGTFSSSGASSCSPCPVGEYASLSRTAQCQRCSVGHVQPTLGSTFCLACEPGTYQPTAGKSSCLLCDAGKYTPEFAQSNCLPCDTQVTLDRRNCSSNACPRNYQYDSVQGCVVCPLGTNAPAGGKCSACVPDYYTPGIGVDCASCRQSQMDGLICSNGLASVAPGYWAYTIEVAGDGHSQATRAHPLFRAAMCPPAMCPGGPLQAFSNTSQQSGSLATQCAFPRVSSPLCGACAPGYIVWGSDCVACDGARVGMLVLGILLSYGLVVFFLLSDASSAGFLQILLYFVQTAILIVGPLATWLSFLSFVNFSPSSTPQCVAKLTPYEQMIVSVLMPLILLAELASIGALHRLAQPLLRRMASGSRLPARIRGWCRKLTDVDPDRYIACSLVLLTFSYTQVSRVSLAYLNCVEVGATRVVFSNPTMDCDSAAYRSHRALVLATLLLYIVGFPLCSIVFLRTRKRQVDASVKLVMLRRMEMEEKEKQQGSSLDLNVGLQDPIPADTAVESQPISSFLLRYGPLFAAFRSSGWWWSSFVLVRRALFTMVDVALVTAPATKFMAFTFLNFYTLCGHALMRPFMSEELNHAEWASQVLLVTISVLLTANPPPYRPAVQLALLLLVAPLSIALVLLAVRHLRPMLLGLLRVVTAKARSWRQRLSMVGGSATSVEKYASSAAITDESVQPHATAGHQTILAFRSSPRVGRNTGDAPLRPASPRRDPSSSDPATPRCPPISTGPDAGSPLAIELASPLASPSGVHVHSALDAVRPTHPLAGWRPRVGAEGATSKRVLLAPLSSAPRQ